MECSQALTPRADFSSLTVKLGMPVEDFDKHARLTDMKNFCWMLWFDISGETFTQEAFVHLLKFAQ